MNVVYLPDYDINLAKLLVSGSDIWLNTPLAPLEASGTSGMKAALNGVPSLSILDGWWIEGCIEGVTGWAIGGENADEGTEHARDINDANALYEKLDAILSLYQSERKVLIAIMRSAIALNGSFFNTQRMVQQYAVKAYLK